MKLQNFMFGVMAMGNFTAALHLGQYEIVPNLVLFYLGVTGLLGILAIFIPEEWNK